MNDRKEEQNRLMRWSAVILSLIAIGIFVGLYFLGKNASVRITELNQDELQVAQEHAVEDEQTWENYLIVQRGEETDSIEIPLDGSIASTDISTENHYFNNQIVVVIAGANKDFFRDIVISGNKLQVQGARYHMEEDGLHILFSMDRVYEFSTEYTKNKLTVSLQMPKDTYEKIVLLDPDTSYGNITWRIASEAKKLLEENDVKVYLSRSEKAREAECDLSELAGSLYADLLIGISLGEDADSSVFGTKVQYDSQYFTPGITNVMLADALEHKVAIAIEGNVLGIEDVSESEENTPVPAARLIPGYATNKDEYALLNQGQYGQKIAQGIVQAVLELYDNRSK